VKTYSAKAAEVQREWHLIDASGKSLGRLASEIASRLRGKHKPIFTPHVDTGDYIVVVNAAHMRITGRKMDDKLYHRHSGYIGNMRTMTLGDMMKKSPEQVLKLAVKGMLPRNPLGRAMAQKLKIFAGPEHPHQAQQPTPLEL
jgi:large subunit ribosomal protein L13